MPSDTVINSDRSRLKAVLGNLVYNAVKYHDVSKKKRFVQVSAEIKENCIAVCVKDNGIGIAEEFKPKIYDMFFRASESSKGSGLGLYIVKETLDRLKGSITCQSVENEGSTFEISVPIDQKFNCADASA